MRPIPLLLFLHVAILVGSLGVVSPARATTDGGTCSPFPEYWPGAGGPIPSDLDTIRICAAGGTQVAGATLVRRGDTTPLTMPSLVVSAGGLCAEFHVTGLLVVGATYVLTPGPCDTDPSYPRSPVEFVVEAPPTDPTSFSLELSPLHRWFWRDGTTTTTFGATYGSVPDPRWSRWHRVELYLVHLDGSQMMPSYDSNGEIGIECPGDTRPFPGLPPGDVTARVSSPDTTVTIETVHTYACGDVIEMHFPDAGQPDAAVAPEDAAPPPLDARLMDAGPHAEDAGASAGRGGSGCSVTRPRAGFSAWPLALAGLAVAVRFGRRASRRVSAARAATQSRGEPSSRPCLDPHRRRPRAPSSR